MTAFDWLMLGAAAATALPLVWTYAGYPAWLALRCRRLPANPARPRIKTPAAPELPGLRTRPIAVTALLAAHAAADLIGPRLHNLLQETDLTAGDDLPTGLALDVVLVTDGCPDTAEEARTWAMANGCQGRLTIVERPERSGKAACLNHGAQLATGEFLLFCDARQRFAPDALRRLVLAMEREPRFGAVSGNLEIATAADPASAGGTGQGVDFYWKLERRIRRDEARIDSAIGCTGAIYLLRRDLFRSIPEDTILDDVLIPMRITADGWRVGFEPGACAFDPQPLLPGHEAKRKRRTLAGNFQLLFRHPGWLLPFRNRLWFAWWSHKVLRLVTPLLLQLLLVLTGVALAFGLRPAPLWLALALGQVGFYLLAVPGVMGLRWPLRVLRLPGAFLFLQIQVVAGAHRYWSQRGTKGW